MSGDALDSLTVHFFLDERGPNYQGPVPPPTWGCWIGPDYIGGCGGFGATPLLALRDLCDQIARDEGHRTDAGRLLLR